MEGEEVVVMWFLSLVRVVVSWSREGEVVVLLSVAIMLDRDLERMSVRLEVEVKGLFLSIDRQNEPMKRYAMHGPVQHDAAGCVINMGLHPY